jgi:hypothetical protein
MLLTSLGERLLLLPAWDVDLLFNELMRAETQTEAIDSL